MKQPNFFVAGAPKSGTTALCEYLRAHPDVYFSEPKELNYFSTDFDQHRVIRDRQAYEAMFAGADERHRRVGEGSVLYLYSSVALENIHRQYPDAKIIVMLRNPLEMIPALHQQFLAALYEDEPDVEQAWAKQAARAQGRHIPRLCRQPELLNYRGIGMLGEQIARLWAVFPRKQTHVILFDDFVADTRQTYLQVLKFLDLEDDGRTDFPRINEAHSLRPGMFCWVVGVMPAFVRNLVTRLRYSRLTRGIPALADNIFKRPQARERISAAFHAELLRVFENDINRLATLLGRDLSGWLKP